MKMRAIRKEMEQKASGRGLNGNVPIGSCIGTLGHSSWCCLGMFSGCGLAGRSMSLGLSCEGLRLHSLFR